MTSRKQLRLRAWLVLLAVFGLGGAAGAALSGVYWSRAATVVRTPSIRDGDAYLQVLHRELRLNSQQAASVGAILDETRGQYSNICAEVRPRYDTLREGARARIRTVLTDAQQHRFDEIVSQENCNCPDQNGDHKKDWERDRK
jgi:hypothetical protein